MVKLIERQPLDIPSRESNPGYVMNADVHLCDYPRCRFIICTVMNVEIMENRKSLFDDFQRRTINKWSTNTDGMEHGFYKPVMKLRIREELFFISTSCRLFSNTKSHHVGSPWSGFSHTTLGKALKSNCSKRPIGSVDNDNFTLYLYLRSQMTSCSNFITERRGELNSDKLTPLLNRTKAKQKRELRIFKTGKFL